MSAPSGLGINIGHTNISDIPELTRQLDVLKDVGISKIRVNMPTYLTEAQNPTYRDQLRALCTLAKSMGFYVVWGYNAFPLNSGNVAAFKTALRSCATWMEANDIDEICVGNEEDLNTGYSQADLRTQLKDVCQTIKVTDGFSGIVSTAITTNVYAAWAADLVNWQDFMTLDLHVYFAFGATGGASFDAYAAAVPPALGSHVYCGEFGCDNGRLAFSSDEAWIKEMKRRMNLLVDNGWTSYYYFAYSIGGDINEETRWSAYRGRSTPMQQTALLKRLANQRVTTVSTD